jgi:hypothetical protein
MWPVSFKDAITNRFLFCSYQTIKYVAQCRGRDGRNVPVEKVAAVTYECRLGERLRERPVVTPDRACHERLSWHRRKPERSSALPVRR